MDEKDVFNALSLLEMSYKRINKEGEVEIVTADLDAFSFMTQVERLLKYLKTSDLPVIDYERNGASVRRVIQKPKHFFEYVLSLVRNAPRYIVKHFPYHEFSPTVEIFMRLLKRRMTLTDALSVFDRKLIGESSVILCDELNAFVRDCWKMVRSADYERSLKRTKRSAELNFRNLVKYEAHLFRRYSRLAIVRVDLFYRRPKDWEKIGDGVDPETLVSDRDTFLRSLGGDERFENLVGYVWKIEHGAEKGFHIHCVFFFDGSRVREDITYGRMCGEKWIEVTDERGDYWNCNAHKDRYADVGIGVISHSDREKRAAFVKAMSYLTKPDYYLRLMDMVVGRIFGKGSIKDADRPARGRPRLKREENGAVGD